MRWGLAFSSSAPAWCILCDSPYHSGPSLAMRGARSPSSHFGWAGFREAPISALKLGGLALIGAGIWMIRKG